MDFLQFLTGEGSCIGCCGQILLKFSRIGHAGDHDADVRICTDIADGKGCIFDGTAGQGFHDDKAHVLFGALFNQCFALAFDNVIREHDGFHPVKLQCLFKDLHRVGGQTDVSDLTGSLCFRQRFQSAAGSADLLQLGKVGIMYLVKVDVSGAQIGKAGFDIRCHGLPGPGHALGGQHKFVPDALQRVAQIAFTDGVAPGGVDVIHTGIQKPVHQLLRPVRINALNGNAAEAEG